MNRLLNACERVKMVLSANSVASLELDSILDGLDFYTSITRDQFEEICESLFAHIKKHISLCLSDEWFSKNDLCDVVLAGGTCRMPKVRKIISECLPENARKPFKFIEPDVAVAFGAAVQASIMSNHVCRKNRNFLLIVGTSQSYGIKGSRGAMVPFIPHSTNLSTSKILSLSTTRDFQQEIRLTLFEGEDPIAGRNTFAGVFLVTGIPSLSRGVPRIDFEFFADYNVITANVHDKTPKINAQLKVVQIDSRFDPKTISAMKYEVSPLSFEDENEQKCLAARNDLEALTYSICNRVRDSKLSPSEYSTSSLAVDDAIRWLDLTPESTFEECNGRLRNLETISKSLFNQINPKPIEPKAPACCSVQ